MADKLLVSCGVQLPDTVTQAHKVLLEIFLPMLPTL